MKRRRFTSEFKRSIIKLLLSEAAGHFNSQPPKEAELAARITEFYRLLGKLTMENELLTKTVRNSL